MDKRIAGELVQIDYNEDGKPHRVKKVWQNQGGILVEFVPVVRCKDCEHSSVCGDMALCYHPEYELCEGVISHELNFFCAYGERRPDNG